MVIGSLFSLPAAASVGISVALAFGFGYGLAMRPLLRSGLTVKKSLRLALAGDTVSILTMETVDNLFILLVPGALGAGLASWLFWGSLLASLAVAFVVTVPVNYWLISRGQGHAVVHRFHHPDH
jgi:hypothetical protein